MTRIDRPSSLPKASDRFVVVEASAGTGKTFFLEHRVADLVIEGADLSQILLVTFTDKAVAELRLRIRDLLDRLARATDHPSSVGPGELASGSGPIPSDLASTDAASELRDARAPLTASPSPSPRLGRLPSPPAQEPTATPIAVPAAPTTTSSGLSEARAERSNLIPFNEAVAASLGMSPAVSATAIALASATSDSVTALAFAAAASPPRARRPSEPGPTSWVLDDAAKKRLRDAVTAFDHAPIFTIHGFCYRILVEDAFAAQRLFEQTQVADEVAFDAAFLSLLRERFANVEPDRSLLGAYLSRGDTVDKLRTLLLQCARKDAPPRITYTPGAAIELGQALQVVFGSAIARDALLEKLAFKGTDKRYGPGWIQHVARCVEEWDGTAPGVFAMCDAIRRPVGSKANPGPKLLERVVKVPALAPIADILRRAIAMTSLDEACAAVMLPHVLERIGKDKAENGMFDYNDMLQLVRDALRGPRGPELAARLRARTPWVMIDEFQDTDPVQWEIFRTVWMADDARGLTIVGDPKQAIYGFRGADVATYLDAREELEARGATRVDLDINRRSTAPMVEAVNKILLADGISPLLDQTIRYDHPVAASGDVELLAPRAPITVFQLVGEGRREESRQALAAAIVLEIDKLRAHPPAWRSRGVQPAFTLGHCMVLTRTNVESDTVADVLRSRGIACALVEGDRLFETREAHELADVLAAVAAPRDRSLRMRALRTRYFDVAWNDLMRVVDAPDHHPLIARLFDWAALASRRSYEALFRRVVEDSRFAERALVLGGGERAIINTWHMIELMLEEVARSRSDLHELVTRLRRWITDGSDLPDDRDVQRAETDTDAVKILTVHKAKGLEAPYVFIYGGASPPRPSAVHTLRDRGRRSLVVGPQDDSIQKQLDAEADAENQRLAYVALTRAKVRMYLPRYPENVVDERSMYWAIQRCVAPLAFRKDALLEVVDVVMGGTGAPPAPADALADFVVPPMPGTLRRPSPDAGPSRAAPGGRPASPSGANAASTSGANAASPSGANAASTSETNAAAGARPASTRGANAASPSDSNAASTSDANAASTSDANAATGERPTNPSGANAANTSDANAGSPSDANAAIGERPASTSDANAAAAERPASTRGANAASPIDTNAASPSDANAAAADRHASPSGADSLFARARTLFEQRTSDSRSSSAGRSSASASQPPERLAELVPIAGSRAGLAMLSYTRLSKELEAAAIEPGELPVAIDPAEFDAEPATAPAATIAPDELPPGIDSGLFLHDLFESADLALLRDREPLAWAAEPAVTAMIVEHARERGIASTYHAHAARIVHRTLTAPIEIVGREPLPPLIAATAFAREVEFAYPIPGASSVRDPRPRGLVKGFIDALVAYDDELWVLDYKSDVLAGDPAQTAEDHARSHYTIQQRLYAIAADRLRGRRRLAGMLFSFVRYGITVALTVDDSKVAEWTSWLANLRTEAS